MHLPDSERSVMEVLWERGPLTAREAAAELKTRVSWSKTTSYTMLTRCVEKGYLRRTEPNFLCTPILTKEEVARRETGALLRHDYDGSADLLVAALVGQKKLNLDQIKKLYELLLEMDGQ